MKFLKRQNGEITVILTVWKRNYIRKQLEAIRAQTVKPKNIWIYQNENNVDLSFLENVDDVKVIQSKDINFKFHGRFTLPLLSETEYVAIFDDDTIPGPNWLRNCLRVSRKYNCIVGANGRSLKADLKNQQGFGDGVPIVKDTEVDYVGHCWFFKSDWACYMWAIPAPTFENGEDIHLSAACKILAGIRSYTAEQNTDLSEWGDKEIHLGHDAVATWRRPDHIPIRQAVFDYWRGMGWKPLVLENRK